MDINQIINDLDAQILLKKSDKFGIMVSSQIFAALRQRGLITIEKFSVNGTGFLEDDLPAYKRKFFIFENFELQETEFRIGTPE